MDRSGTIIIGAGAAGLMAARELSAAGKAVLLLEAGSKPGGRILTLEGHGFLQPVEAGAEFIHGDLPLTLQLLKEAGIAYRPVKGKMLRFSGGEWVGAGMFSEGWEELMQKMGGLREDMPLARFLSKYFPEEKYLNLRESVQRFAEGFDLADIESVSTLFLYEEWRQEDGEQYRVEGGYGRLIEFLAGECRARGCEIVLSAAVTDIEWSNGGVKVIAADGRVFSGARVIITASPAALLGSVGRGVEGSPASGAAIKFSPAIPDHLQAFGKLGFGSVTKIMLQFKEAFWTRRDKKMGFLLTDQRVPTWWTQYPDSSSLLTAWIPGAVMKGLAAMNKEELIECCLSSLAPVFGMDATALRRQLLAAVVVDWSKWPFVSGGYSFDTVDSVAAKKIINGPIGDSLFFAGEACYEGTVPGTVEAALINGKEVAEKIMRIGRARP